MPYGLWTLDIIGVDWLTGLLGSSLLTWLLPVAVLKVRHHIDDIIVDKAIGQVYGWMAWMQRIYMSNIPWYK